MAFIRSKMIPRFVDGQRVENGPYFYLVDKSGPKVRQKYLGTDANAAQAFLREFDAGAEWESIGASEGIVPTAEAPYISPTQIDTTKVGKIAYGRQGGDTIYNQTYLGVDIYTDAGIAPEDIATVKETLALCTAGQRASLRQVCLCSKDFKFKMGGGEATAGGGYELSDHRITIFPNRCTTILRTFAHELGHDTFYRMQYAHSKTTIYDNLGSDPPEAVAMRKDYDRWLVQRTGELESLRERERVRDKERGIEWDSDDSKVCDISSKIIALEKAEGKSIDKKLGWPRYHEYQAIKDASLEEERERMALTEPEQVAGYRLMTRWDAACRAEGPMSDYAQSHQDDKHRAEVWHNENFAEACRIFQVDGDEGHITDSVLRRQGKKRYLDDAPPEALYPQTYAVWRDIMVWDERQGKDTNVL